MAPNEKVGKKELLRVSRVIFSPTFSVLIRQPVTRHHDKNSDSDGGCADSALALLSLYFRQLFLVRARKTYQYFSCCRAQRAPCNIKG